VVPEILSQPAHAQIAFLHIDMNSPGPEVGALNALFRQVSVGGIIVFDDYGWSLHEAQKKAVDQFMAEHGYNVLELPTGQGLVVKR
jgi:O-methyltransferase